MEKYRIEACWSAKRKDKHNDSHRIFFALVDPSLPKGRWNWNEVYRLQIWPFESSSRFFGAGTGIAANAVAITKPKLFGKLSIGKGKDKQAPEQEAQLSEMRPPSVAGYEDRGQTSQSEQSVALAQSWLEKCVSNRDGRHTECSRSAKASSLPRRVLDLDSIASTGRVKLVCPYDTSDLPETQYKEHVNDKYITLSHKWEKMVLPVLLDSNIQDRVDEGLDFATLPETFKQAVVTASWFNVRWLYIDCLCIIQDSHADWVREAASMARYYSEALLCISATYADDARMGCWTRRDPKSLSTPLIHAKNTDQSWFVATDHHYQFSWMLSMPLFDRAWCHRERQLSPRILHFTDSEIVWECCGTDGSSFASETFPGGAPFKRLMSADTRKFQSSKLRDEGRGEILAVWNDLCEGFSQKSLTKATDMPIILSSLAEEFLSLLRDGVDNKDMADDTERNDDATKGEYIAGLWKSTLPQSLLWKVTDMLDETSTFDYVAPSWSWMSLRSPIELYGNRISGSTKHQLAILESVTSRPQYEDQPFGPLASAELELTCIVRKIRLTEVEYEQVSLSVYEKSAEYDEWREIGIGHDDYEGDLFKLFLDREWNLEAEYVDYHICFIELDPWWQKGGMANNRDLLCLLLEEVESQSSSDLRTFRRVGLLKLHDLYALKMRYQVLSQSEEAMDELARTANDSRGIFERMADKIKYDVDEVNEERGDDWKKDQRQPDPMLLYAFDGVLGGFIEGEDSMITRLEAERIVLV
ncbi:putative heterokaryon incompatibility [Septoria linicola]|nr:putative heterokaryon incompatibility [Septoria linicola]